MIKELGGDVVGAGEQTGKSFGSKLVSLGKATVSKFSDGEISVNISESVRGT